MGLYRIDNTPINFHLILLATFINQGTVVMQYPPSASICPPTTSVNVKQSQQEKAMKNTEGKQTCVEEFCDAVREITKKVNKICYQCME